MSEQLRFDMEIEIPETNTSPIIGSITLKNQTPDEAIKYLETLKSMPISELFYPMPDSLRIARKQHTEQELGVRIKDSAVFVNNSKLGYEVTDKWGTLPRHFYYLRGINAADVKKGDIVIVNANFSTVLNNVYLVLDDDKMLSINSNSRTIYGKDTIFLSSFVSLFKVCVK